MKSPYRNNAIIFGITGQDGYYMKQHLEKQDINIIGISRKSLDICGDISDTTFVDGLIKTYKPNFVFHFAADSTTSHKALWNNHNAISLGTLNILESVKIHSPNTKVYLSGSAVQFKNSGMPINEQTPFEAKSHYAAARIYSVYLGRYYRDKFGIKVYVGYFFNHDSPRRSERHINKKITAAAIRISKGSNEKLEIGNYNVKKEFNYAGDIVEAVWALIQQEKFYEAVVGSGDCYTILDWIRICFENKKLNWEKHITIKENFKSEYNILVSDPSIIKSLGWKPKITFHKLAVIMLEN